ncbi:alpha/beta hydrolase [Glycomyces harbinensis]|uniref:Acetyl esterase/lipase n=1 Tax=Glycomyces harbinensis TaxID=58114 RepID=A0A1G6QYA3_9ACTN|nr:alpha/beta hydrolase [Glycomyces harbinensis]SDC97419.1 Acetyl esterase/lipase [Glycomyces harbinensis]
MPVDEYFTEMFRGMAAARAAARPDEDPEALVEAYLQDYRADTERWDTTGVAVEDTLIEGPHGPVPIRVYRPESPTGALLWAHGGGFRHGDIDMPEGHIVSIELARRAAVTVASVDYRLADGEVRYPVPIDDVHAAWTWLCSQDLPEGGPVAIGGASAGAALALSASLRARDSGPRLPDALLLAYPFAHYPNPALSPALSVEMAPLPFRFEPEGVEEMVRNYVGRISDVPADALPGAARLDGLPRTLILAAEYDDLRASAELLERQLREAGVPVEAYLALGMTHGHLNHSPNVPEVGRSLDFFAKGLNG